MSGRSILAVLALVPAIAQAGSIYLNGVNIDGVTNQKFEKASVRIDEKGNLFIEAPGYAVKRVEPGQGASTEFGGPVAKVTKRYWLVTEQTAPGMTEYEIDLYINAKWVRKLRNDDDQIISEVTKYLQPGKNTILLTATKVSAGKSRRSFAPEHVYRVVIGEGNVGGDNVMIDNPMVRFERTAADNADASQEFSLTTR